jgi:hypothetical protein
MEHFRRYDLALLALLLCKISDFSKIPAQSDVITLSVGGSDKNF